MRVAGRYNEMETSRQARLSSTVACMHDRFLGNVIPKNASGLNFNMITIHYACAVTLNMSRSLEVYVPWRRLVSFICQTV
jgi:hypothetical protein